MAEMALGYGSEYQLLRYLGHHRNAFFQQIQTVLNTKEYIHWLDYPVDLARTSLDGELKGINCFSELSNFDQIKDGWERFWPQSGNQQNWDGVFRVKNTWYFVEAKANLQEANQTCKAKNSQSRDIIVSAFEQTCGKKDLAEKWVNSNCYQLANRLAFIHFCEKMGIKAKLFYVNFINGYLKDPGKNVISLQDWKDKWSKEYKTLELDESLERNIYHVYVDCAQNGYVN